jgi:hypothetical protein
MKTNLLIVTLLIGLISCNTSQKNKDYSKPENSMASNPSLNEDIEKNSLSDSTDDADETVTAADYFHLSGGIDWKLSWANLILGVTFASSSASFENPFNGDFPDLDLGNNQESTLSSQRYQFIIGFEIPILDNALKKLNKETE